MRITQVLKESSIDLPLYVNTLIRVILEKSRQEWSQLHRKKVHADE